MDEYEDFSSENEDYIHDEDEETDDDLCDTELGSDDEEYVKSRQNIRIDKETYNDISKYIGMADDDALDDEIEMPVSECDDSDDGMCSYETDDEFDVIRNRYKKVTYDPKCDHNTLLLQLGMQF